MTFGKHNVKFAAKIEKFQEKKTQVNVITQIHKFALECGNSTAT